MSSSIPGDKAIQARISELERRIQVEDALERVRARSMAMYDSSELSEVAALLFKQLGDLGAELWSCGFAICRENELLVEKWMGSPVEGHMLKPMFIPYNADYGEQSMYDTWKHRVDLHAYVQEGEDLRKIYEHLMTVPSFLENFAEVIKSGKPLPVWQKNHVASFKHGYLLIITTQPFEDAHIFPRFAKVFEQTYTRFLDLQKAEAQAREAQIQVALERVRARVMAMHHSQELSECSELLYKEFLNFEIEPYACGYVIGNFEKQVWECWNTNPHEPVFREFWTLPFKGDWVLNNRYESWKRKEKLHIEVLEGEANLEHHKYIAKYAPPTEEQLLATLPNKLVIYCAYFSEGHLLLITQEDLSSEIQQLFVRFADAFDLTYRRFLDLQKAEAQAREAVREASLDRVRAEIASMRTADDLQRITPLVWRELSALGVPFSRCGVFIVDEDAQITHTYLSTPDGTSLAALHLPFDSSPLVEETVAHWRRRQVYTVQWDQAQFAAWVAALVEQEYLDAIESYQGGEEPPESLALHFMPFTQGMLYVGSAAPLADDQIDLARALADAFSVAYARYEDFTRLEVAKARVETALSDLKSTQQQLIQQEKLASLGQLTAGIAHEIKNPLNFVNNFAELIKTLVDDLRHSPDARIGDELELIDTLAMNAEKIHEHGRRADRIVESMMRHASGATGERQKVDLNAFVDQYVNLALHSWHSRRETRRVYVENTPHLSNDTETRRVSSENISQPGRNTDTSGLNVVRNYDERAGEVELVPQEIGQVLVNLFNNAFDAMMEQRAKLAGEYQARLVVSTKRIERAVEIRVADNGAGIPRQARDRIFEPFFTTKPTGSGTGLGLSLSYDIITKGYGGRLEVQSTEGEGATFVITLTGGSE